MLKKYYADLFVAHTVDRDGRPRNEVYLAADVDKQLNDLRQAIRVVLSEWKEIEGSKIQSELRKLLADSYRTTSAGACQHRNRIGEESGMGHKTYEVCADCGHRFI